MNWFKNNFQYDKQGNIVKARVFSIHYNRVGDLWQICNDREF